MNTRTLVALLCSLSTVAACSAGADETLLAEELDLANPQSNVTDEAWGEASPDDAIDDAMLEDTSTDGVELGQLEQALTCTPSQQDRVGDGFNMESAVSFDSATGGVAVTTRLKNSRSLVGFTGGVIVVFTDANALPLYATTLQKFGLDACGFRCPRRRTVVWNDTVPADVLDRVAGISILQDHTRTNRFFFQSLDFVQRAAAACASVATGTPLGLGCMAASLGAAAGDPILGLLTDDALQRTISDMFDSIPARNQSCI